MNDKILRFPGSSSGKNDKAEKASKPATPPVMPQLSPSDLEQAAKIASALSEDQQKALGLIMSGASFVLIALKPSETGCDFFTALHGDATDLRNAQPHLSGVIDRLYTRRGI